MSDIKIAIGIATLGVTVMLIEGIKDAIDKKKQEKDDKQFKKQFDTKWEDYFTGEFGVIKK